MCALAQIHTMKERESADVAFSYCQIHKEICAGFFTNCFKVGKIIDLPIIW